MPAWSPPEQGVVPSRVAQEAPDQRGQARPGLQRPGRAGRDGRQGGAGGPRRRGRFDPASELVGGLDHFGPAGMRERVELAGGTWTVWSREGSGTVLTATLPKARVAA